MQPKGSRVPNFHSDRNARIALTLVANVCSHVDAPSYDAMRLRQRQPLNERTTEK